MKSNYATSVLCGHLVYDSYFSLDMFEPWTTTFSFLILVLGPDRCWSSEAERRLLDDLLANYQKFERPVAIESDPVNLKISISLQQVRQFPGLGSNIRVKVKVGEVGSPVLWFEVKSSNLCLTTFNCTIVYKYNIKIFGQFHPQLNFSKY